MLSGAAWRQITRSMELSPQQARIVCLILCGKRDKQIAAELGLGVPTVRTYLSRVFERAKVEDRVELILRVFELAQAVHAIGPVVKADDINGTVSRTDD